MNIFKKTKARGGKRKFTGFTLIELLVVISIISFISSVVLVMFQSSKEKSNDTKIAEDLRQFGIAVQLYFDDHKAYPTAFSDSDKFFAVEKKTTETNDTTLIKLLDIFSIKKALAIATDQKCLDFDDIANSLVSDKYLSSKPKHPKDDRTTICYKAVVDTTDGLYFTAYGQLSTKISDGTNTYKKTGIILGDTSIASLESIYAATNNEYPVARGGGPITDLNYSGDIILGLAGSNSSNASSSLYTIDVVTTGNGSVSNTGRYASGASVTLTASPSLGYAVKWKSGCTTYARNSCTVVMGSVNKTVEADFVLGYSLYVYATPSTISPFWSYNPAGNYSMNYSGPAAYSYYYYPGQLITLSLSTAPTGYTFTGFSGCSSTSGSNCYITMPSSNKTINAYFSASSYSLFTTASAGGSINRSTTTTAFPPGSSVTLTAIPLTGYYFSGWGGDCLSNGTSPTCTLTMNSSKTVTAAFSPSL